MNNNRIKFPSWTDLFILLGIFVAMSVLMSLVQVVLLKTGSVSEGFGSTIVYVIVFAAVSAMVLFYRKRNLPPGEPLLRIGFKSVNFAVILWSMLLIQTIGVVIEPLLLLMPEDLMLPLMKTMTYGGWSIILSVVCAPVLEELLFRGLIQESFTYKYGPLRGILISAAVFGVIHFIPQQVVSAFFAGIVLGYVYYITGSLINAVIVHMLNNALAYVVISVTDDPLASMRDMLPGDAVYYTIYGISCIIVVISAVGIALAVKARAARIEERAAMKAASKEDKVEQVDTTNEK